jgi:hypothetical protein
MLVTMEEAWNSVAIDQSIPAPFSGITQVMTKGPKTGHSCTILKGPKMGHYFEYGGRELRGSY